MRWSLLNLHYVFILEGIAASKDGLLLFDFPVKCSATGITKFTPVLICKFWGKNVAAQYLKVQVQRQLLPYNFIVFH